MNNSCVCFSCKDVKMALLKGRHSLLRYLGFIAAIFACAVIWIGMYLSGIICFYIKCGSRQPANKFGKTFYNIYLNSKLSRYYPHMVSPILLHVFLWFCMMLTAVWLYFSVSLIVDYYKWSKARRLRKSSKRWIIVTIIICAADLLLFLLFVVDFSKLKSGMLGASVRSMGDYDDSDRHIPSFADFKDDYDAFPSNRNMFDNLDKDPSNDLTVPGVVDDAKEPVLTFDEHVDLIKTKLADKHTEIDEKIKELTDKAAMIVETELGTYYNPMAQMRTAELQQQLIDVEKLYRMPGTELNQTETPPAENEDNSTTDKATSDKEDNKETSSPDARKKRRSIKRNLEETAERKVIDYDERSFKIRRNLSKEMIENSQEDYDDIKNNNFYINTNSSFKFEGQPLEEINDELKKKEGRKNEFKFERNSRQLSAKEEYDIIWRSMFDDDGFGIILQNQGPGIGLRRAMAGGTGGVDMVLAPSAVLMTLAIRGYLLWVFNLTSALMVMYLYITRPRYELRTSPERSRRQSAN